MMMVCPISDRMLNESTALGITRAPNRILSLRHPFRKYSVAFGMSGNESLRSYEVQDSLSFITPFSDLYMSRQHKAGEGGECLFGNRR